MSVKRCSRCISIRSLSDFAKCSKNQDGLQRWCNECRMIRRRELACRPEYANITAKTCSTCKQLKPIANFDKSSIMRDGYAPKCKKCHNTVYGVGTLEYRERRRASRKANWARAILHGCKERALRDGVVFNLKPEDITIPTICPILGIPLVIGLGIKSDSTPSIDRIIPELGYVPDNIAVISWKANRIKGKHTDPRIFEAIAHYLRKALGEKMAELKSN